jgi:hypothetical protein
MLSRAEARAELTPLVRNDFSIPGTDVSFTTACFEGSDWSLAPLQYPEDAEKHPDLAHRLRSAMRHLGADRVFAPSPAKFNGQIILPERLNRIINLGHKVLLLRNKDVPADGTFLRSSRDAGIFSAGGCGLLVAAYRGELIFAHAGRDCVLDRERVRSLNRLHSRDRESVVDYILDAFKAGSKEELADVHFWPLYSIKPEEFIHEFDHPEHGAYNQAAASYITYRFGADASRCDERAIYIDIPRIIKRQCIRLGVPEKNICLDHAYLSDELPHTRKAGGGRYLVATVRH